MGSFPVTYLVCALHVLCLQTFIFFVDGRVNDLWISISFLVDSIKNSILGMISLSVKCSQIFSNFTFSKFHVLVLVCI